MKDNVMQWIAEANKDGYEKYSSHLYSEKNFRHSMLRNCC